MNKTQRGALITLIGMVLDLGVVIFLFAKLFVFKALPGIFDVLLVLLVWGIVGGICILLYRKKQSAVEVESDERDDLIKKRAVMVSFVSIFILLAMASVIPRYIVGGGGSIPVYLLPIINVCIFILALLVYSVAVLVQYGRGGKDGEE